jgi:hypothetical protein
MKALYEDEINLLMYADGLMAKTFVRSFAKE